MSNQTEQNHMQTRPADLLEVLQRYHAGDCGKSELKTALNHYQSVKLQTAQLARPVAWHQIAKNALASFTLFPHGDYEYLAPARSAQTSEEAIASHWRAVGRYLSYALIHHIVEEPDAADGAQ